MKEFKNLRIVDNFYQSSLFFPMPTIMASTVSENGRTNLGFVLAVFPVLRSGQRLLRNDIDNQKQF